MPPRSPRPQVTVETLLQLKRAERPDAEFWTRFEAELRQKQLAALVERRSWWQQLPQFLGRRAYLPLGATAVLAFTLVSVRHYLPAPATEPELVASVIAPTGIAATVKAETAFAPETSIAGTAASTQPIDDRTPIAALPLSERLPEQAAELVPWSAPRIEETPSARALAANLARLEENDPELVHSLFATFGPARDLSQSDHAAAPADMAAPGSRPDRLLAHLADRQFTPDPAAPEVVRERHARRLGDMELAGGWNRLGVKADRVSLRF